MHIYIFIYIYIYIGAHVYNYWRACQIMIGAPVSLLLARLIIGVRAYIIIGVHVYIYIDARV